MLEQIYTVRHRDATIYKKLRTSALLALMTDISADDMEAAGAGIAAVLEKGAIWVAVRTHAEIERMPTYGETVTLQSGAGRPRQVLYPRWFRMLDAGGNVIVASSMLWTLADINTRHFAFASEKGIEIHGEDDRGYFSFPPRIKRLSQNRSVTLKAPYSYIDLNGHLSNMHYLDLVEDNLPQAQSENELKMLNIEYAEEILPDKEFTISFGSEENLHYITGESAHRHFSLNLEYGVNGRRF